MRTLAAAILLCCSVAIAAKFDVRHSDDVFVAMVTCAAPIANCGAIGTFSKAQKA